MSVGKPLPIVRNFLVCQDVIADARNPRLVSIIRVLCRVRADFQQGSGAILDRLCVYVQLTECRGDVELDVRVRMAESGAAVRATSPIRVKASEDPVEIVQASIAIEPIWFPRPGSFPSNSGVGDL